MANVPVFKTGLEDVVAGTSGICYVQGREGRLAYCGYDIRDLAEHSTFEEVIFLLYNKRLPTAAELADLDATLRQYRPVEPQVLSVLSALPRSIHPMAALRTAVSLLGNFDATAEATDPASIQAHCLRLDAQVATVVAAWTRIRQGLEPVPPSQTLSHAANFLYMLTGTEPDPELARVFDVALILHADHELNAATFSGRVTIATLTDVYSAVLAAVGTLKGPLHGGANERVMEMEQEIGDVSGVEAWVAKALEQKRPVVGFGHRVYRTKDPRAVILERYAEILGQRAGDPRWCDITRAIEQVMLREKGLYANVDLYSGPVYTYLSIPRDLFTAVFAVSRVAGWTAHILEQIANNRTLRPRAEYTGPEKQEYVPVEAR